MTDTSRMSEKRFLRSMFEDVSDDYDFLNHLMTFGMDHRWRRKAASLCAPMGNVLDLCCGPGELLFAILRRAGNGAMVLGVDFTREMINGADTGGLGPFTLADAAHLPFREESFDCVATAFSFRNLLYKNPGFEKYMGEVLRILRSGRTFLILETSQPEREVIRKLFHLYLRTVVPLVGGLVSGSKRAYRYLSLSALNHPTPREVSAKLVASGFRHVEFIPLSFGIVGVHIATK